MAADGAAFFSKGMGKAPYSSNVAYERLDQQQQPLPPPSSSATAAATTSHHHAVPIHVRVPPSPPPKRQASPVHGAISPSSHSRNRAAGGGGKVSITQAGILDPKNLGLSMSPGSVHSWSAYCFLFTILGVIFGEYLGFIIILLFPLLFPRPVKFAVLYGVSFNVLFALLLLSFVKCMRTDPGTIPENWGLRAGEEAKRLRYCRICNTWKPERTHHCSVCQRCILCMDHHCPYLLTCVGFYNRKFFLQLLVYSLISSIIVDVHSIVYLLKMGPLLFPAITDQFLLSQHSSDLMEFLLVMVMCVISLMFSFALLTFTRFHVSLIARNATTIENLEVNARTNSKFDLGARRNIEQVMGSAWYLWWLPTTDLPGTKPVGDGVRWRLHYLRTVEIPGIMNSV